MPFSKSADTEANLNVLLDLVRADATPNINRLWALAKDIEAIKLNVKFFGYELARELYEARAGAAPDEPGVVGLCSKPSTQADIEAPWVSYWSARLGMAPLYHRKVWELCYVMQALCERGALVAGARGLGFGCGQEPLPSAMAALGIDVTVTDLDPAEALARGWITTTQHASTLDHAFKPHLVDRDTFERMVHLKFVDMNAIDRALRGFDFCWSICALEHLGSIANGLAFIEASLDTLKPGGIAVHTTEFNFLRDDATIDNWPTVLFQRRHFKDLAARLVAKGHEVAPLDFDVGAGRLDRFIDVPPYADDLPASVPSWREAPQHLKLMIDGFASTCFGLIIRKAR
ncbi:methyltransferase domain-containing protein [Aquabacter sp. L1I39]|uniref:class I SAM-dependent methyltransferase n=1 Tax=Aquabacter sp. L1I39 TaxID=2820278 RepID=UPI001AD98797|nr:methyltransferase domain-containing protein [Aquabacter sp. L1I39]QTL04192.1 methyltransferase domain-containing protein [Aquabacter sp. L1I39]